MFEEDLFPPQQYPIDWRNINILWNENNIIKKIFEAMQILNIDRMPTVSEIRRVGKFSGLEGAITKSGGFVYWANKLSLNQKKPTKTWNDKEIENRILHNINLLNINRMPSRNELLLIEDGGSLHNAIVRSYGYYEWANRLHLDIKESETSLGIHYQNYCYSQLNQIGYRVDKTSVKAPYDLIINENIRVDVKSGCAYYLRGSRVHTFGINKKLPTCDIYIIYALDEKAENIERTFIIPSKSLKLTTLCIGKDSKYNKYLNRWDYIDSYSDFYKTIN